MRNVVLAISASFVLGPLSAAVYAAVPAIPVEQIENYENAPTDTAYAPVHFPNGSTVTAGPSDDNTYFPDITFAALTTTSGDHYSGHANAVGNDMYGIGTVAYPYVANTSGPDVYCLAYDTFLNNEVITQDQPGMAVAPGDFQSGVKVVNNSYIVDYGSGSPNLSADTDALRRIDSMIDKDNVTFVAGAVTSVGDGNTYELEWSSFNSLAVSGSGNEQSFSPSGGPGKQHADLFVPGDSSWGAGTVSGYATALYGNAASAGQTDAMQNVVNRSLLMTAADKNYFSRDTANNLSIQYGAGAADDPYFSLGILQAGEKPLLTASVGGVVSGAPSTAQAGWSYGAVAAGGQDVVLFQSGTGISNLTASLNWNVTSAVNGGQINTSTGAQQFANLTLEVVPVTANGGGSYTLGANQSNAMLYSRVTGDNVQYIYDTSTLAAGTYAFVIGGDSSLSPAVGFSYTYAQAGSSLTQWNSSSGGSWAAAGNWTSNSPDGRGAEVSLLASLTAPGVITLDGDRTVGQLTFSNANGYTIASGTGGFLNFDDNDDASGTVNPLINVTLGSQTISAPITIASGYNILNINVSAGSALTLIGTVSAGHYLFKNGPGSLSLDNVTAAAAFAFQGGVTTLSPTGSLVQGPINVNATGTLNFAAPAGGGILVRNVPVYLIVQANGLLTLAPAAVTANRQLLVAGDGITLAGSTGSWTGTLDLNNNDLDEPYGALATVTNQILQGYNGGKWNGSGGILSSAAAANTTHLTALGVIQNNQGGSALFTASHPFDGTTPGTSDILVKYTYYGDANLDGKVDGSDYSLIDNGYLAHLTGWYNGDFNYDGVVNGSDYTLIDNAYNTQGAAFTASIAGLAAVSTAQISAVPEPGVCGIVGLACVGVLSSRRRRVWKRHLKVVS